MEALRTRDPAKVRAIQVQAAQLSTRPYPINFPIPHLKWLGTLSAALEREKQVLAELAVVAGKDPVVRASTRGTRVCTPVCRRGAAGERGAASNVFVGGGGGVKMVS